MATVLGIYQPVWVHSLRTAAIALLQVIGASLFIGLCAQISISLPFTPVPISMQTFAVLLTGCMLGPKRGVAAVLLYIAEGCAGLPVFAGGHCGFLNLIGPKGGYILGYILQAYCSGWIVKQKIASSPGRLGLYLTAICLFQMSVGVLWLAPFVGWKSVLVMGFYPFVPGELLKSFAVAKQIFRA